MIRVCLWLVVNHLVGAVTPLGADDPFLDSPSNPELFSGRGFMALATATAIWWLASLPVVIRLDRWTLGYRRPLVLTVVGMVWLIGTLVMWWWSSCRFEFQSCLQ